MGCMNSPVVVVPQLFWVCWWTGFSLCWLCGRPGCQCCRYTEVHVLYLTPWHGSVWDPGVAAVGMPMGCTGSQPGWQQGPAWQLWAYWCVAQASGVGGYEASLYCFGCAGMWGLIPLQWGVTLEGLQGHSWPPAVSPGAAPALMWLSGHDVGAGGSSFSLGGSHVCWPACAGWAVWVLRGTGTC